MDDVEFGRYASLLGYSVAPWPHPLRNPVSQRYPGLLRAAMILKGAYDFLDEVIVAVENGSIADGDARYELHISFEGAMTEVMRWKDECFKNSTEYKVAGRLERFLLQHESKIPPKTAKNIILRT